MPLATLLMNYYSGLQEDSVIRYFRITAVDANLDERVN